MMERYDPRGSAFARLGRFNPDETACALWWSGAGVRTRCDGARLEVEATAADDEHIPFMSVTVDGAPAARFALRPGTHHYDLLGRMEPGVCHEVAVLRDSQPTYCDTAPVVLDAFHAEGRLSAPDFRPRLVEFLGDSLTVGEGTVGPQSAMEWRMLWISNQFAFPSLAAEALHADKRLVALGGWGACLSFDANPEHAIGRIYDRLCGACPAGDAPYDFAAQRKADAVVINLGTNDAGAIGSLSGAQRDAAIEALEDCAVWLLKDVRRRNPQAAILWAYGLCGKDMEAPLRRAVERRIAAGDDRLRYLDLDDCGGQLGSRMHPGRAAHRRAAAQIIATLEEML